MIYFEEATEMGFNVRHQNAGEKSVIKVNYHRIERRSTYDLCARDALNL